MTSIAAHPRAYYLDWLRILAFGLLVPYHVGMYYVDWDWHIKSAHIVNALEPWMRLLSPWRMDLLFVVSGAATSFMLMRRGADRSLLRERATRLLLPLLFGMLVIVPPQSYLEVVQHFGYAGSMLDFLPLYLGGTRDFCSASRGCLVLPTWNHLWYLPYLFAYTLVLWGVLHEWPNLLERLARVVTPALDGWRLLAVPIVLLAVTRIALRARFPVTHALVDDWFMHTQYVSMFMFGAVLARAEGLALRMQAWRSTALALALGAWAALLLAPWDAGTGLGTGALRPLVFSVQQWCAIVAALGFAHRHLDVDAPLRRYFTDAVFPVYILHQTLIIVLAHALQPWGLAPAVEAPLLVGLTFGLGFAGFEVVRRVRWLRPVFGLRRVDRPWRAPGFAPRVGPTAARPPVR